jgi:hypothetical protein
MGSERRTVPPAKRPEFDPLVRESRAKAGFQILPGANPGASVTLNLVVQILESVLRRCLPFQIPINFHR